MELDDDGKKVWANGGWIEPHFSCTRSLCCHLSAYIWRHYTVDDWGALEDNIKYAEKNCHEP